jgi:hypothetical protein
MRKAGGIWQLIAVIVEMVLVFVVRGFLRDGKLSTPVKLNLLFFIRAGSLVTGIIKAIIVYKTDPDAFRKKYIDKPVNSILLEL